MKRKTANIDIRVEPQLIEKIDAWRAQQRVAPSRAAAIGYMLEHFLEHDGAGPSGTPSSNMVRVMSKKTILAAVSAIALLMVTSGTGQAWVKQQEYSPLQKCLMAPVNGPQDFAALNERCAVAEQVQQQEQQLKDAQASAAAHAEALRQQDLAALQRDKDIAQEKLRQDAAQARHEEIIKAYKSQVAKAEADQAQRGYKAMTLDDFLLDSQKLVAAGAKVAVAGSYKKLGQSTVLFPNAMAADSSDMRVSVPVLIENADRNARKYLLSCDKNPAQMGCNITVLGHATMCTRTTVVGTSETPCIEVEDGWNVPIPN